MRKILDGQLDLFSFLNSTPSKAKAVEPLKVEKIEAKNIHHKKIIYDYKQLSTTKRIVQHCCGGLLVAVETDGTVKTLYFNKEGDKEMELDSEINPLPMDTVIYSVKTEQLTEIQKVRLKDLRAKHQNAVVIHRRGDKNVMLKLEDKIIAVNPQGWVLEYKVDIQYSKDEILREEIKQVDLKEIQNAVKVGDIVTLKTKDRIFDAEVTRIYGNSNESLCIRYGVVTAICAKVTFIKFTYHI